LCTEKSNATERNTIQSYVKKAYVAHKICDVTMSLVTVNNSCAVARHNTSVALTLHNYKVQHKNVLQQKVQFSQATHTFRNCIFCCGTFSAAPYIPDLRDTRTLKLTSRPTHIALNTQVGMKINNINTIKIF